MVELCRTRADYRALWDRQAPLQGLPPRDPIHVPCKHLGGPDGWEMCHTCKGRTRLKAFLCGLHGRCVLAGEAPEGVAVCVTCHDYVPHENGEAC